MAQQVSDFGAKEIYQRLAQKMARNGGAGRTHWI
jgi:hypothetical protein